MILRPVTPVATKLLQSSARRHIMAAAGTTSKPTQGDLVSRLLVRSPGALIDIGVNLADDSFDKVSAYLMSFGITNTFVTRLWGICGPDPGLAGWTWQHGAGCMARDAASRTTPCHNHPTHACRTVMR